MDVIGNVEKNDKDKKTILLRLDEEDVILWNQIIITFDKYDPDDPNTLRRLQQNKDEIHKAFTLVRPS